MEKKKDFNVLAIVGFILSLTVVFSIVGIILCIVAIVQISGKKQRGMGLAIAGLIVGVILPIILIGLMVLGLFVFFESSAVVGSGNVVSENYDLSGFESVTVQDGVNLIVTQGDVYSVEIMADDNVLELLEVEVTERGSLEVGLEDFVWLSDAEPIMLHVTMPEVTTLSVEGSGGIESVGLIESERLILRIFGSGDISVQARADELSSRILGSGDISVSGIADEYDVTIEGSGSVDAFSLIAKDVSASIFGSGDMELYATETLDVTIDGSGDVRYKGSAVVSQDIGGSGSVVAV